jgi:hypothetical protein
MWADFVKEDFMPQPRKTANLSDSVRKHLDMYALAASAAGVGMLALAPPAQAKIVYTHANVTFGDGPGTYSLDLNHDKIPDFTFQLTQTAYSYGSYLFVRPVGQKNGAAGSGWAYRLQTRALIGPKQPFRGTYMAGQASGRSGAGSWFSSSQPAQGYLGVKFKIRGQTHYGWARLTVKRTARERSSIFTTALTGYAYETIPNKPIIAGKTKGPDVITVQAPTSLGHLARGADAIPAWRGKD